MLKNKGFTLLEILIALFVFTIVSLITTSALHYMMETENTLEKNIHQFDNLQFSSIILSHDMEQIVDRSVKDNHQSDIASLLGMKDEISFSHLGQMNPLGNLPRSTIQRVHYFLKKYTLIRETWPELDITSHTQATQRKLLDHIKTLEFFYLDNQGKFQISWPTNNNSAVLPRAIKIVITFENGETFSQIYLAPGKDYV